MIPNYINSYKNEEERLLSRKWFVDNKDRIDPKKKTIWFLAPYDDGTCHFRIAEPMRGIAKYYPDKYNLIFCDNPDNVDTEKADVIVMHRTDRRLVQMMERCQNKVRLVYDMDDSIYLDKNHPSYHLWYSMAQDSVGEVVGQFSDCVVVTQSELQKQFKKFNKNVFVIRNAFDFDLPQWNLSQDWLREKNDQGKLVIGWSGAAQHLNNIFAMKKFFKILHDKYPHLHFVLAGMPKENIYVKIVRDPKTGQDQYMHAKVPEYDTYAAKVKEAYKDFDQSRIDFLDVVPVSRYSEFFSMFNICVAYLRDNKFNRCRSEIKIIEGLIYGAVPVYSYIAGYKDFHDALPASMRSFHNSVIRDDTQEWVRKLSNIIENYSSFKEKALDMKNYVKSEYDLRRAVNDRVALFEELTKGAS